MIRSLKTFGVLTFSLALLSSCSAPAGPSNTTVPNSNTNSNSSTAQNTANAAPAKPAVTPSNKFTAEDVAKLKWLEGTWRGMNGDKPFYERYKLEGTKLFVENLKEDGSREGEAGQPFELKDGEFGKTEGNVRFAASEISDTHVQFVSPSRPNTFRFEKQPTGWNAVLETPATDGNPAEQKVYKMEPWVDKR